MPRLTAILILGLLSLTAHARTVPTCQEAMSSPNPHAVIAQVMQLAQLHQSDVANFKMNEVPQIIWLEAAAQRGQASRQQLNQLNQYRQKQAFLSQESADLCAFAACFGRRYPGCHE